MLSASHVGPRPVAARNRHVAGQLPRSHRPGRRAVRVRVQNGGNILDADQHAEVETGLFFMRLVWDLAGFKLARADIEGAVGAGQRFDLGGS